MISIITSQNYKMTSKTGPKNPVFLFSYISGVYL